MFNCDIMGRYIWAIKWSYPIAFIFSKNTDSTLIIEHINTWYNAPYYLIISKKGDTISCYSYKNKTKLDTRVKTLPKAIRDSFLRKNAELISYLPTDINIFFNPQFLTKNELNAFWNEAVALKMWLAKDDKVEGEGCKNNTYHVSDAGAIGFYFITKTDIKQLYFYAPYDFEKHCPGREGRIKIIALDSIFRKYMKE